MAVRLLEMGRTRLGSHQFNPSEVSVEAIRSKSPKELLCNLPFPAVMDRAGMIDELVAKFDPAGKRYSWAPRTVPPVLGKGSPSQALESMFGYNAPWRGRGKIDHQLSVYGPLLQIAANPPSDMVEDLRALDRYIFLISQIPRISDSFTPSFSMPDNGATSLKDLSNLRPGVPLHSSGIADIMGGASTESTMPTSIPVFGSLTTKDSSDSPKPYVPRTSALSHPAFSSAVETAKIMKANGLNVVPHGIFHTWGWSTPFCEVIAKLKNRLSMLEAMIQYPWPGPDRLFFWNWLRIAGSTSDMATFLDNPPVSSVMDARSMVTLSLLANYEAIVNAIQKQMEEAQDRAERRGKILVFSLAVFGAVVGLAGAPAIVAGVIKMAAAGLKLKQKVALAKNLKAASEAFENSAPEFAAEINRVFESFHTSALDDVSEPPPPPPPQEAIADLIDSTKNMEDPVADTGAAPTPDQEPIVEELKGNALTERAELVSDLPSSRCKSPVELGRLRAALNGRRAYLGTKAIPPVSGSPSIASKLRSFIASGSLVRSAAIVSNLVAGKEQDAARVIMTMVAKEDHAKTGSPVLSPEAKARIAKAVAVSVAIHNICKGVFPGGGVDVSELPPDLQKMVSELVPGIQAEIEKIGVDAFIVTAMKQAGQGAAAVEVVRGSGAPVDQGASELLSSLPSSPVGHQAVQAGRNDILNAGAFTGTLEPVQKSIDQASSTSPLVYVAMGTGALGLGLAIWSASR